MAKITVLDGPSNQPADRPGVHIFTGRVAQVALAIGVPPAAFDDRTWIQPTVLADVLENELIAQALADLIDDTANDT